MKDTLMFKQFGVKFGDNDFHRTFEKLLPAIALSLYDRIRDYQRRNIKVDKELIASLINKCVTGFYYAYQNPLAYDEGDGYPDVIPYLMVKPEKIYIDDELSTLIDDLMKSGNHNGELFCVCVYKQYDHVFHGLEITSSFWSV